MDDKKVKNLMDQEYSTSEIARELKVSERTVQRSKRRIKNNIKEIIVKKQIKSRNILRPSFNYDLTGALWLLPEDQKPINRVVGIIPDLHLDASKIEYLKWLIEVFKKWNVTDIVCLGDIYDQHAISLHPKEPESKGVIDELESAKRILNEYKKVFPVLKYCIGNHCRFYIRKAAEAGIPESFMKSFKELLDLPDTWDVAEQHVINNCLFIHGTQFNGRSSIASICNITGMSTICGHQHSIGGIYYSNTGFKNMYAMICGCLIDTERYNFKYGSRDKFKPVLGCGIVIDDQEAYFIKKKGA